MKKEKTITEICPISGVTAAQLLDQCEYLIKGIPASYGLDSYEKNDSISNTVLRVLDKMNEGKVPKFHYPDFKDYLFIALKTNINRMYHNRKYLFNNITNDLEFDVNKYDVVEDSEPTVANADITMYLDLLSDYDRAIVEDVLTGTRQIDACKKVNRPKHYYNEIIYKIRKKLAKTNQK